MRTSAYASQLHHSQILFIYLRRMSDPGTTYRTREEVQRMRSTQDPIRGLQRYIEEWGLASEKELKVCDLAVPSITRIFEVIDVCTYLR